MGPFATKLRYRRQVRSVLMTTRTAACQNRLKRATHPAISPSARAWNWSILAEDCKRDVPKSPKA